MNTSTSDASPLVVSGADRIKREMEVLLDRVESGESLGQLLLTKVRLQHRIQRLRDEQDALQQEALVKSLKKCEALRSASIAQNRSKYMQFIDGKIPGRGRRRRQQQKEQNELQQGMPPVQKKQHTGSNCGKDSRKETDVGVVLDSSESAGICRCPSTCNENQNQSHHRDDDEEGACTAPRQVDVDEVTEAKEGNGGGGGEKEEEEEEILKRDGGRGDEIVGYTEEEEEAEGFGGGCGGMSASLMDIVRYSRLHMSGKETHAEATRRARERAIQKTEERRQMSLRRFNLVEEMFQKAVERRMRAMRRIAADPPADRLIGGCVVQHIPFALIPGQLRDMAQELMAGASLDAAVDATAGSTRAAPEPELDSSPQRRLFLTSIDATAAGDEPAKEVPSDSSGGVGLQPLHIQEEQQPHGSGNVDHVLDERQENLLRQWRELGYTAVYLPASRRLVYPGGAHNSTGHGGGGRKPYDPNGWMRLQPLPPLHLLQRRLSDHQLPSHSFPKSMRCRRPLPPLYLSKK